MVIETSKGYVSPVIMEMRARVEMLKLQPKLADLLLQAIGPGGKVEITLFENESGYSLRATSKNKFIFEGPAGTKRAAFNEIPMDDFLEWCAYFYAPEFEAYIQYDEITSILIPPQEPPSRVWLREKKLALIDWVSRELDELSLLIAEQEFSENAALDEALSPISLETR